MDAALALNLDPQKKYYHGRVKHLLSKLASHCIDQIARKDSPLCTWFNGYVHLFLGYTVDVLWIMGVCLRLGKRQCSLELLIRVEIDRRDKKPEIDRP